MGSKGLAVRKLVSIAVLAILVSLGVSTGAQAQGVIGTVEVEPMEVPAAGEYTFVAEGSGFIADSSILVVSCTSPAPTLVVGESDSGDITEAALAINALTDCDIAGARSVDVDGNGRWESEITAQVGDNFFLSAGSLDGSQSGAMWVPIAAAQAEPDAGADDEVLADQVLAETGVETALLAVVGASVAAAGVLFVREVRRVDDHR